MLLRTGFRRPPDEEPFQLSGFQPLRVVAIRNDVCTPFGYPAEIARQIRPASRNSWSGLHVVLRGGICNPPLREYGQSPNHCCEQKQCQK